MGDWIVLDALRALDTQDRVLELCLLTDADAERMFLQDTTFSISLDGKEWVRVETALRKTKTIPLKTCMEVRN